MVFIAQKILLLMIVQWNVMKPLEKSFAQHTTPQSDANLEHCVSLDLKIPRENIVQLTLLVQRNVHGTKYYVPMVLTLVDVKMQTYALPEEKIKMATFAPEHALPSALTQNLTVLDQSLTMDVAEQVYA